jgi:exosortase/archaeosortase family protein
MLWLGVVIALDDHVCQLWPKPSPAGVLAGSLGLTFLLTLSPWLFTEQNGYIKFLLLPIIMFVLASLNRPVAGWKLFKAPLLISLLLPLSGAIQVLSSPLQNRLTAFLAWTFLYGLGFQPTLSGKQIFLDSSIVAVETPCNGIEQLIFSVSMIVIFQLIFPLEKRFNIFLAIVGAAISATALNVVRIALLAFFTTWPDNGGRPAFDFFHGSGGTIFSLLAAGVAGWIYVLLLDRELAE